jgi:hypothetical protein
MLAATSTSAAAPAAATSSGSAAPTGPTVASPSGTWVLSSTMPGSAIRMIGGTPLAHWLSATGREAPAIVMPVSAFWSVASATGWSTRRHSAAGTLPTEGVTVSAETSTAAPAAVVTVTMCVALTAATFIGATSSVAGTSLSGGRPDLPVTV